jgi:4-alpha-glucanotransferase
MNSKLETRNSKLILDRRRAGVLLHPTSLPAGDLGVDAHRFVDFLAETGAGVWQTLPLGPTHADSSPYHCLSAHAGSPRLIALPRLVEWGWLEAADGDRRERLHQARAGFVQRAGREAQDAYQAFVREKHRWLEDYALFEALRKENGSRPWWEWEPALRDREPSALEEARARLADDIEQVRFEQFVFARQWTELRVYARGRGVLLFGDMPIFVAHDSAEVWAHREYFKLDARGQPTVVAGVPPDYFSATGQRWGNPLYRWERLKRDGFGWWLERLATELERLDLVRVDHFRGFEACWEIPAADETAVNGRWVKVPGRALFKAMLARFGRLPLVAEDLGLITPAVERLRRGFRLPGMGVLQFAFEGDAANPYLPHHHEPDCVVYTGTHDNDTTRAWFEALPAESQLRVMDYLGFPTEPMPLPLVRAALASVTRLAIVPMQDVLMLGRGHRMNTPGTSSGNWRWRFEWEQLTDETRSWLRRAVKLYGRT